MTVAIEFKEHLEQAALTPEQIQSRVRAIHSGLLSASRWIDAPDFEVIHPDDLVYLFDRYDELFFQGLCRSLFPPGRLSFRISSRMTKAGGKTTRIGCRHHPEHDSYEIAVSSTLLFETFDDVRRPNFVTGIECHDRLEALQRIFEHELIHLIELLLWNNSSCAAGRFQSIASRFFGHTDHRHKLVTPRERAFIKFGIRPGSRVRFRCDGTEYTGFVNRITRRATVLVEDPRGVKYSDGKRYGKFYVPLELLEPAE